ncbi:keratin-associated protein 16-1-like [Physella acuta]|uniref:keratin-associated protein 16-1-like n=1 Tax=Physella acuta TaxID=109671 RepID=UPI0027DCBE0B|nr:keratin-associated protein 16-1-like [Physella acuta]
MNTIKNDTVSVCGGVFCSRDADCAKDELCCPSACGGFLCTRRSPVTPNPPRVDIENPCLFIKCSATTVCRVVYKCQTCEPTVQCVNSSLIDASLDRNCRKGGYSEVLLVDGPTPTSNYVPLVCRHERDCPRGSMCVGDRRGEGTCCRGRIEPSPDKPGVCPVGANLTCGARCDLDIDCPDDQKCCQSCGRRCTRPQPPAPTCPTPCPRGTTCTWTSPVCSPGMACPAYVRYECTPDPCLTCRDDEKCVLTSTKGYQCQPRNPCGRTCPAGQQCQLTRTVCASGTDISPRPTGCRDIYECRPVDLCGGCLQGTVCIDTGIRCITTPCPTYQCVPDNACGGCRPGQRCRELLACSPPATCNKNAPCPPVCSSVFQCTSAPEPVVRPPCPLPCPPLTRCEIQHKKCKGNDRLCAWEVSYKCRPLYGDD